MTPVIHDSAVTVYNADALDALRALPAESIHCCVTSPPYWGLRDYGVAGQIGLEQSFQEYVQKIVAICQEVWRVLRNDGTCWVNLGDSYASNGGHSDKSCNDRRGAYNIANRPEHEHRAFRVGAGAGIKPKDMIGMPWRVAFALQAAGWYLRSDIIWHKPNPMPESCRDRPTKAHEYLFLLTKSERYFYDSEAIKEKVTGNAHARGDGVNPKAKRAPSGWNTARTGRKHTEINGRYPREKQNESFSGAVSSIVTARNKRSVWKIPTKAFSGAHFATFPPALVTPCILAGTSAGGCCADCGAPRKRIIELGKPDIAHQRACGGDLFGEYNGQKDYKAAKAQNASEVKARILAGMRERKTVGWKKTCKCETEAVVPATVLDPFGGSGTTGEVALLHGRRAILIELNPDYIPLIARRTSLLAMT